MIYPMRIWLHLRTVVTHTLRFDATRKCLRPLLLITDFAYGNTVSVELRELPLAAHASECRLRVGTVFCNHVGRLVLAIRRTLRNVP